MQELITPAPTPLTVASPATWHISEVIWAAIIAAGIAFVGSALTNRHSRKQLERQLAADARERQIVREMALRRDVYLPAVEAVTRCHGVLGQLTDLNADVTALGRSMANDLATISKTHLIAGEATVKALMEFLRALMPAYMELIALRAPLVARQQAIALQNTFAARANTEQSQLLELMKQYNLSGNRDPDAWARLNTLFKNEQQTFRNHNDQATALARDQQAEHLRLISRLSELAIAVAEYMPAAVIAAREELELPIDPTEYRRLFTAQQQDVAHSVKEMIDKITGPAGQTAAPASPVRPAQ